MIDFITTKEIKNEEFGISFTDFKYRSMKDKDDTPPVQPINIDIKNKLEKEIDVEQIKKEFVDISSKLSNKFKKVLSYDNTKTVHDNKIKMRNVINKATFYVATNGRIGPASNMIISKKNYEYIKDYMTIDEKNILFYDIDDIILYRKNNIDQPGVILIHNNEKYEIVDIGYAPEKQFCKVKIKEKLKIN